jgi:hypothetical protein
VARFPSQRVKLHRSYSVEQAAKGLNVHKNTVRRWIKDGLPTVGDRGQTLILGFVRRPKQRSPTGLSDIK